MFRYLFLLFSIFTTFFVEAEVPNIISYQGYLTDTNNVPLSGNYNVTVNLYKTDSGGISEWSQSKSVLVQNGIFNIELNGDTDNPFPTDLFNNQIYVGISLNTDIEMSPRNKLTVTPYSIYAKKLIDDSLTVNQLNPSLRYRMSPIVVDANDVVLGSLISSINFWEIISETGYLLRYIINFDTDRVPANSPIQPESISYFTTDDCSGQEYTIASQNIYPRRVYYNNSANQIYYIDKDEIRTNILVQSVFSDSQCLTDPPYNIDVYPTQLNDISITGIPASINAPLKLSFE